MLFASLEMSLDQEVASTGVGDDGQFCGGGECPTTNYYCGFTWMQCGAIVRLRRPISVAITNNAFVTRNGHVINCNARMLMPNACNKYEELLTQTTPSTKIDYIHTHQNKRYDKVGFADRGVLYALVYAYRYHFTLSTKNSWIGF